MAGTAQDRRIECTNCGGLFRWVRLPGNHWVPADLAPSLAGHFLLLDFGDDRVLLLPDEDRLHLLDGTVKIDVQRVLVDHRRSCDRWGGRPVSLVQHNIVHEAKERARAAKIRATEARH